MPKPFRFGLNALHPASPEQWKETARKAEAFGYSTFVVADHIYTAFAPLTSLVAAAEATTTIRIGSYVLGNDFWHPAVLARELATIDVLSQGRLEFGFGTGWEMSDYEQRGITKESPALQVDRFSEAIQVVKGLFGEQAFSFTGKHYSMNNYSMLPKPIQKPYPPLMIGGGRRRMLRLAVEHADIVGINPSGAAGTGMTAESTDEQVRWIREYAGERLGQLEFNTIVLVVRICDDRRAAAEQFNRDYAFWDHGLSIDQMLESPTFLFGSVAGIAEQLHERRERYGISYLTIYSEEQMEAFAPVVATLAGK
jgi:probable F420-dependent oxidoreductase